MRRFTLIRGLLPGLLFALAIACGSGGGSADDVSDGQEDAGLFGLPLIANTDTTYTVDDLVSVGYKKSKHIDTETLPNAQDAWYGFFNQLDIEVWVYKSHQDALDFGVEPAEAISEVERAPVVGISVLPTERFRNKYATYAVFGNLVMLCETELATCEALIAELD
ncbi:MAG: hypothetical protein HQ548_06165 [Chloroflexi bacterium]|nr:hypothetical protein [Chloroflexota bacterium]